MGGGDKFDLLGSPEDIVLDEAKQEENELKQELKDFDDYLKPLSKEQKKTCKTIVKQLNRVNMHSFFDWKQNNAITYLPKKEPLRWKEEKALWKLKELLLSEDPVIQQFFTLVEAQRWNNSFSTKKDKNKIAQFDDFLTKQKTETEATTEQTETEKSDQLVQKLVLLLADTDMDGKIDALDQLITDDKWSRKKLEKTQKEQWRGTVSETQLESVIMQSMKNLCDDEPGRNMVATNIVSYLKKLPQWPQGTKVENMSQLVQLLQTNPVLLWQIRNYARMMPEDFQTLLNWWVDAVVAHATQFDTSIEQTKKDEALIAEYLSTPDWQKNTLAMMNALHEKFRGIQLFIDTEQQKILKANQWAMPEQAKENAMKYHALQDAKDALDNKQWLRKSAIDLIYAWWLVSVIPEMQWAWAWVGVRFYEGKLTDFVNSIDMHLAGFQQLWWSKTTSLGLQMTVWWTITSSRKNTLFYALNGGVWMQLIQWLVWLGRNAGLTLGDELWINEKKMKSFDPVSKKFVWILAWASISGDFTSATVPFKPFSVHAWLYYRRDKLAWLSEQEWAVYMMVTEIVNAIKDPSLEAVRKTVTEYCKTNKIKQSPEELDRVARVLHTALIPYTALVWKQGKETSRPTVVAEQVTRNRYNSQVEQARSFAVTWVWLGVWVNFLGIYPQVWVQFEHRKSAVYMPDKDSERHIGELIATPWYEQKLTWSFSEQVDNLISRFGLLLPEDQMNSAPREVLWQWVQDFVLIPDHIVGKQIDLRIAPNLIQNWVIWFQKKDNSYEIPADLPIKIVDIVENNAVRHVMVIGDIKWENAIPLTPEMQTATDDTWITNRLVMVEKVYAEERIKKVQDSMATFFQGKTERNIPFVVNSAKDVGVNVDPESKKILSYAFPLKAWVKLVEPLPDGVKKEWNRLVIDSNVQFNTTRDETKQEYHFHTTPSERGIVFGYGTEVTTTTVEQIWVNVDLLDVDPKLEEFLRSTEGSHMLLEMRGAWTQESTKNKFYAAITKQNYDGAYTILKPFIEKTSVASVFAWVNDRKAKRADLYAIYGALSRVRMTEYKHLNDASEKSQLVTDLFDQLKKHPTYKFSKLSEEQKTLIRSTIESGMMDPNKKTEIELALRTLSPKFIGRWDKKYYYEIFKKKNDPMYKLIFLIAPVSDVFDTRRFATEDRLRYETGAKALMPLYDQVSASLRQSLNLYSDHERLTNHVGLVFWYESWKPKKWIIEKFVFHPHMTWWKQEITPALREQAQNYFLENYFKDNYQDVEAEVTTLITKMSEKINTLEWLSDDEKKQRIDALKADLLTSGGKVKKDAYFSYQKDGTISALDGLIMSKSVEWNIGAYSDCINFMITKGQPSLQLKNKKTIVTASEPTIEAFTYEPIRVSGPIVVSETIVANTADRRASKYSAGIIGGINKKQYTTETSTTTPVDLTQEDFDKITFDGWQTSVTISTTNTQVDAFPWKIWWKSGIFYADPNTGNWQFFEGNIAWNTFNPATNATLVPVADIVFGWRHLDAVNSGVLQMYMAARIKNVPYDAYRKQQEAYKKLTPEQQKAYDKQQKDKLKK
jgi:hypothetical protein